MFARPSPDPSILMHCGVPSRKRRSFAVIAALWLMACGGADFDQRSGAVLQDAGQVVDDMRTPVQGDAAEPPAAQRDAGTAFPTLDAGGDSAPEADMDMDADTGGGAGDDARVTDAEPLVDAQTDAGYARLERAQIGKPVLVANGFSLAEGPLWDPCRHVLLFADVDPARLHQLMPPTQVSVLHEMTNYTNGITFHPSGDLLRAEMGGTGVGRITRVDRAGNVRVIADKNPSGQPLNTPDDLTVRSDGTIYFTDPTFAHGPATTDSIFARPVYRITPESAGHKVVYEDSMPSPNGIELTRDEKTLYIASYLDENVYRYDVAPDGSLGTRRLFLGNIDDADSLCLDAAGNLYVGASAGLRIYRPDASSVGTIAMPTGDKVTNCAFGGVDGRTLYITAWKTLWRIEGMPIPGLEWEKHQSLPCGP